MRIVERISSVLNIGIRFRPKKGGEVARAAVCGNRVERFSLI